MKILLAITTGRKNYKITLDLLVQNFLNYGHFKGNEIGVVVNYDCTFMGLTDVDFTYKTKFSSMFSEKIYIGQKHVPKYKKIMKQCGINDDCVAVISQSTGYSNKKNLVYIEAFKKGYEIVLFWDDDEYPYVCKIDGQNMSWLQTDILGAHLAAYKIHSADVAFGFYTGYASPIPSVLTRRLSKKTAKHLGRALSVASDVVNEDTFIDVKKVFVGLVDNQLIFTEIKDVNGGKWISGGNLSVRISSVKNGIVPPYYTPAGTRADDTILSMGLHRAKVIQVPAGIFHDAFGEYEMIKSGVFPCEMIKKNKNSQQIKRFCLALKGWFGYAPIFLRIKDVKQFNANIAKMQKELGVISDTLIEDLPELKKIFCKKNAGSILNDFFIRVESDYEIMKKCYEEWKKISVIK